MDHIVDWYSGFKFCDLWSLNYWYLILYYGKKSFEHLWREKLVWCIFYSRNYFLILCCNVYFYIHLDFDYVSCIILHFKSVFLYKFIFLFQGVLTQLRCVVNIDLSRKPFPLTKWVLPGNTIVQVSPPRKHPCLSESSQETPSICLLHLTVRTAQMSLLLVRFISSRPHQLHFCCIRFMWFKSHKKMCWLEIALLYFMICRHQSTIWWF